MKNLRLYLNTLSVLVPVLLICSAVALRADNAAAIGTWDCVSETPDGDQLKWTLTVKEDNGKLTGVAGGELPATRRKNHGRAGRRPGCSRKKYL